MFSSPMVRWVKFHLFCFVSLYSPNVNPAVVINSRNWAKVAKRKTKRLINIILGLKEWGNWRFTKSTAFCDYCADLNRVAPIWLPAAVSPARINCGFTSYCPHLLWFVVSRETLVWFPRSLHSPRNLALHSRGNPTHDSSGGMVRLQ